MATKIISLETAYLGEAFEILAIDNTNVNLLDIAYLGEAYAGIRTSSTPPIVTYNYVVHKPQILYSTNNNEIYITI